jgi:hypothetical protein
MSIHSVTLDLPEAILHRARLTAQAARRPLEEVLTATLIAALPEVDGAPEDMQEELARMTWLDEQTLWSIARSNMTTQRQERLRYLAELQSQRPLTQDELANLEELRQEYGRITLRKGRAYALLSLRGGVPLLAEN